MMILHVLRTAGAVILTFGLVIFLHESGHFVLCRLLGVRVEKFSFGFGPELLGWTRGHTRYSISALPLGGYVRPAGEELDVVVGQPADAATGAPDEYFSKPWYQRFLIVAAGPVTNYLLSFLLFAAVFYFRGFPEPSPDPVIGNIVVGYPADQAGIQVGDRIASINGLPMSNWDEMSDLIHKSQGKELMITVLRKTQSFTADVTPRLDDSGQMGVIGIMRESVFKPVGVLAASRESLKQCRDLTLFTVRTITSKIMSRQRPDIAGPVGIVQMVSKAAQSGWDDLVYLIGLISVAIGFFNILPLPLLDGGNGAVYLWEGISGKRPTEKVMAAANGVGIALLMSLLLFATYNDLLRLRSEHAASKPAAAAQSPAK